MRWPLFFLFIFFAAIAYSISVEPQINSDVASLFGNESEIEVIVVLKNNPDVPKENQHKDALSQLNYDFDLTNDYTTFNGFAGKLKRTGYLKLSSNPNVLGILKSGRKSFSLNESASVVNATNVWRLVYEGLNITGKGESICVIDSGIDYTHPSLGNCSNEGFLAGNCSKVIAGHDFVNDDELPLDDQGHGTHVAGIIASNNETYKGIAPDATLVAIKVCDNSVTGNCEDTDILAGIDWCVNNATKYNISVISMSLGGGLFSTYCDDQSSEMAFKFAIDNATSKNISVVVATGNSGGTTAIASPACLRNSIAVTSTEKNDVISSFSNRNSITDLAAPGSLIKSTVPKSGCVLCDSSGFLTLSGTSMAAPHVAASFALLHQYKKLEQNITLTPSEIQSALNRTGKQINDTSGSGFFFSRINALAALLSLDTKAPAISFASPTPLNNSNITASSLSDGIFINITSNEILVNATLEWNGTNETMEGSGLNWFKNKSSISLNAGNINFRVFGNDSAKNTGLSDSIALLILNASSPVIAFSAPTPANNTKSSKNFLLINITSNQALSIAILEWNGTNETMEGSGLNWFKNKTVASNQNASYAYRVWGNSTFGIIGVSESRIFISNNTPPIISSANLTNTDELNRTNGTLQAKWGYFDLDNDEIIAAETMWYLNNTQKPAYANKTFVHYDNTTKSENWTFSVRVFDGMDWSDFANSSAMTITNSKPIVNTSTSSLTVYETQLVNISFNAYDIDNDKLKFGANKSEFLIFNGTLLWHTNLTSSGAYEINITANDSFEIESIVVNVTVTNARDIDDDGNPDFNDSDDDNDKISDENDFLIGNSSSLNSSLSITVTVNGTANLSKLFNGTFLINLTNGTDAIAEFNFTFNSSNMLDLGNLTLNVANNGSSALSVNANLNLLNSTKTFFLKKLNATAKSVCIKDANIGFDAISSACDSSNETLVICDNSTSGQYACFDFGAIYKVTGLKHSAVKEQCRDIDGDSYGTGCFAGTDCDDNDAGKRTDSECNPPNPSPSGGGGGSAFGVVCSMDWQCNEWSACINGVQSRKCDFVKVPQHVQETECPSLLNKPTAIKKCEAANQNAFLEERLKERNATLQNAEQKEESLQEQNFNNLSGISQNETKLPETNSKFTGFVTKILTDKKFDIFVGAIALIFAIALVGIIFYKQRQAQ